VEPPTLGQRLRNLRTDNGWTLAELAGRSGTSVSYLNDLEHDRTVPSLSKLQSIAESYGLDASLILRGVKTFGLLQP
jgi:transcriptional regulator with XRE-family HTH domain